MNDDLTKELFRTLIWVVADLSFIILNKHPGESLPAGASQQKRASIELYRPVPGTFSLTMESCLLQEMTGAIYGLKTQGITSEKQTDTLLELTNTFAGRFMKIIVPATTEFQLGLPIMTDEPAPDGQPALNLVLDSDKGCLMFSLIGDKLINGVKR